MTVSELGIMISPAALHVWGTELGSKQAQSPLLLMLEV